MIILHAYSIVVEQWHDEAVVHGKEPPWDCNKSPGVIVIDISGGGIGAEGHVPTRIEDYALIGDCETAALVARDGSIDWLCFPRFDSPACFAALLGTHEHGRWLLAPADGSRVVRRRYRPGTFVLETEHETESGAVRVI